MKKINPKNIKHLLIRSTNWIGDAVMTTPAVRSIKKHFCNARIYILAKPWVAPVFAKSPYVDEIIIFDSRGRHKGTNGILRLSKDLRRYNFDAAILLQNAIEAALISFFGGIPNRIGFNTDARGFLLTHPVPCTKKIKQMHQTRYYLKILNGINLFADDTRLDLFIGEDEKKSAQKMLQDFGISSNKKIIGINPGATYGTAKQWLLDRFAKLSDLLHQKSYEIIIFGGPGEEGLGKKISAMMNHNPLDLAGKTTLRQAFALINECDCFITNDSGLMHIAAALDIPLVAIFGSTNPITTSPHSQKKKILRIPVECSPCMKPDCIKEKHFCMENISVEMVFEAVEKLGNIY